MNLALTLQFLASGVPSASHLQNFDISRRALTPFQESPFDFWLGVLSLMVLVAKEMVGAPLSPSILGIHTEFQDWPRLFFEEASTLKMVSSTILWQR